MTNLLAISAGEKIGLIVIYGISAIGAVLIVKDVIVQFINMYKNHKMDKHDYYNEDEK